ncbi:MAG: glyoxalase [Ruminococcaceae bacterium]|nr:glyoxalase [Oscillospiraceae bacterium]
MEHTAVRFDHAAMYVRDLAAAKHFFEKYFGAESGALYHNTATGFRSYFLSFGGARLELMQRPDITAEDLRANRTGYVHIALGVGSTEAVDALTARLRSDGYAVLSGPRTTGDGYYESCIAGPEGNLIEITV